MKKLPALALALLILSAIIIGYSLLSDYFSSKCTVGIVGYDAVIDIKGSGAKNACDELLLNENHYFSTFDKPARPVICVVKVNSLTYTFKGEDLIKKVGPGFCADIQKGLASP